VIRIYKVYKLRRVVRRAGEKKGMGIIRRIRRRRGVRSIRSKEGDK
jgi:hypothetical protein